MIKGIISLLFFFFTALPAHAVGEADQVQYPESELYSKPVEVVPGVWSAIGATQPPTYENAGHNNNLSFILTDQGVLVVNGGASYRLAEALHTEIRQITKLPVKYVVNENGQGHAMLGNVYWREQSVPIIAHVEAAKVFNTHAESILERMQGYNKERAEGTTTVTPDIQISESKTIQLGDTRIEIIYHGEAHSAGDIAVLVPERDVIITGDMAFHQRLLPIFSDTDIKKWITSFDEFSKTPASHIIPGHGEPTDIATVTKYTKGYLVYMVDEVEKLLEEDMELEDAYLIDQSAYSHLDTFEELAAQNAGRIFRQLEEASF